MLNNCFLFRWLFLSKKLAKFDLLDYKLFMQIIEKIVSLIKFLQV